MDWIIGIVIASWWTGAVLLEYAHAWPSGVRERNDYGERHRTS